MRTGVLFLVALIALMLAVPVDAAEKRCDDLGANCVCSEPFNTNSYSVPSQDFFNPADSTTKQCSNNGVAGGAVVRTSPVVGSNDATARAALPSGHTVNYFLRPQANNHEGTFTVGSDAPVTAAYARLAARWYVYHSPDFAFKDSATSPCQNTKIGQLDHVAVIDYTAGFHTYGYQKFSPPSDCCMSGPGGTSPNPSQMRGKWWRWEIVMTKRSGPGFRFVMYGQNVTDRTPEVVIIDLSQDGSTANLTPPSLMSQITSNNHRWSPTGSGCAGFRGISHYLMAGWTSDAGQRMGPAAEVEAGGTLPPPTTTTYTLTATAQGAGTVTGAGSYPSGTVVTPVAVAASGSTFSGWSGDCSGSGACTVTMTANKNVTAMFTTPTTPPPTGSVPPAPLSPTVTLGTQDPTGATFNVSWPAVSTATSYSYTAGLSDNSANLQGAVTPPNLLLTMPYMANGAAGSGFVCIKSVNAAGSSAEAACNSLAIPAKPAVVPPQLTTGTLTADASVSRCTYFLTAEPPDATGGWVAQFYRDGSNKVGNPISAAPYKRSVELYAPSHSFSVQFTKTGQVMRSPAVVTRACP